MMRGIRYNKYNNYYKNDMHLNAQVQVQCCFTSTETIRTIRDGETRTATSSLTQLLSSDEYFGNEWAKINTFRPVTKQILVYIINFPQKPVRNRTVLSR